MLLFEVLRFQLRLSFLRNEEPEEGVVGSSGLEIWLVVSVFGAFVSFCALGPVSLAGRLSGPESAVVKSLLVLDLDISKCSPPVFGRDEETNGDTVCLGARVLIAIGFKDSELLPTI